MLLLCLTAKIKLELILKFYEKWIKTDLTCGGYNFTCKKPEISFCDLGVAIWENQRSYTKIMI